MNDVRAFLGLANYFRKFIDNYSAIAAPLVNLTKGNISKRKSKATSVGWDDRCQQAFEALKKALIDAPVLALPDFSKPFELTTYEVITDASDYAIGAILVQDGRPIAYESKKLTDSQKNYHTTDRELLAVVHALQIWRCYLEGPKFKILTDHNSLTYLKTQPLLSRRQARWSEFLQGFDIEWVYLEGPKNPSDSLSRMPQHRPKGQPIDKEIPLSAIRKNKKRKASEIRWLGQNHATIDDTADKCRLGYEHDPWFANDKHTSKLERCKGIYFKGERMVIPNIQELTYQAYRYVALYQGRRSWWNYQNPLSTQSTRMVAQYEKGYR